MTVHCTKIHPIQYKFGKVNDMLTFYNKQGDGWNNICISKYFKQKKTDDASGGVQQMTTSQQFEELSWECWRHVGDMSCRHVNVTNFPDIPFFCRHPFLPIWPFPRV